MLKWGGVGWEERRGEEEEGEERGSLLSSACVHCLARWKGGGVGAAQLLGQRLELGG